MVMDNYEIVLLIIYLLGLPLITFIIFKNTESEDGFEKLCCFIGSLLWPGLFLIWMIPWFLRKSTLRETFLFPNTDPTNASVFRFMKCKTFHKLGSSTWARSQKGSKITCSCQRVYFFNPEENI
jgi:hypothetical protein